MKLTSFRVKGFKNFTNEVKLENLGDINVLHGPNNVGKSNLLQAMQLFFDLLGIDENQDGWLPIAVPRRLTRADFEKWKLLPVEEIFSVYHPAMPIEMEAELRIDLEELKRSGIQPLIPCDTVRIESVLQWEAGYSGYQVRRFVFADGTDAAALQESAEKKAWVLRFASFLNRSFLVKVGQHQRFGLIPALRPIDHELALQLYDAKESTEIELFRHWEQFAETMGRFGDILGEGTFVAIYDRRAGLADLVFQTTFGRVPLRLLGSGVQQLVHLLGHLQVTNASIVAIEEPELNLKYDLQQRLREVFAEIVGKPGGPSQLFLTSHSPAFESGSHFYFMTKGPDGPTVERMENRNAMTAVGFPADWEQLPKSAAQSYISTDGVVRLPKRVLGVLEMPHGGGVLFIDGDRSVEMMSNERFIERLGLEGGDGSED